MASIISWQLNANGISYPSMILSHKWYSGSLATSKYSLEIFFSLYRSATFTAMAKIYSNSYKDG